jgi:hypothetical protein
MASVHHHRCIIQACDIHHQLHHSRHIDTIEVLITLGARMARRYHDVTILTARLRACHGGKTRTSVTPTYDAPTHRGRPPYALFARAQLTQPTLPISSIGACTTKTYDLRPLRVKM